MLTPAEVAALDLSPAEQALLKPYYRAAEIGRFTVSRETDRRVLYLTRSTAATLDGFPRVRQHLERFLPLLERRREVERGRIAWWHLHWPREERLFTETRILAVQMGRTPRFALARHPTYVGFAVNLVREREAAPRDGLSLDALAGLLNSALAARWFDRHAKHRGVNLDISGDVLSRFPLPPPCAERAAALGELVDLRCRVALRESGAAESANEPASIESRIDRLVAEWYSQDTFDAGLGRPRQDLS